jgi:hypothetical protein
MKTLLLFLAYTFACTLQTYAQNGSDRDFENLIGPVHKVRLERAMFKCESGECVEGLRRRSTFDDYDIKGNIISSNRNRFDPNNPQDRLHRYPFGDGPPVIEKANVEPDGTVRGTYIYSYNNLSRQSEWIICRPDGSIEQRILNSFNFDGRLSEQITYDSNMQVFSRTTYAYDAKGNEIEWTNYDKDGSVTNVNLFEYELDKTGNWVKKVMTIKRPKDGQLNVEAIVVYYRTITYH